MNTIFDKILHEHTIVLSKFFTENQLLIEDLSATIAYRLRNHAKFLCFGNGGSASDASHFVGELVGRFKTTRKPIAAIDLTSSNAMLTAISNDYGFEEVFARQVTALAQTNDIILGISTSGTSQNVINAFEAAPKESLKILLTSSKLDEDILPNIDIIFKVPSVDTPRIQEVHIIFLHILVELIESKL